MPNQTHRAPPRYKIPGFFQHPVRDIQDSRYRVHFLLRATRHQHASRKLVFTVLGAVAELERSLIVERVRAGMRNARAKGKQIGRPPLTYLDCDIRRSIYEIHKGGNKPAPTGCQVLHVNRISSTFDPSVSKAPRIVTSNFGVFNAKILVGQSYQRIRFDTAVSIVTACCAKSLARRDIFRASCK
jgi:resolvase-like protein